MAEDLRKTDAGLAGNDRIDLTPGADTETVRDSNPDALTGAPGSHPLGTGIGAASAGAAGAMIGSVVPGIGTIVGGAIGAVVGAVAGGLAGKAVAEAVNPSVEEEFWRTAHVNRPYIEEGYTYENDYRPAYQYGWESRGQYAGRSFAESEADLQSNWEKRKGQSRLQWDKAQLATRDAWARIEGEADDTRANVRGNLPGSAAAESSPLDPDSTIGTPATGVVTPPPLPGESRAQSDLSHRGTGTLNIQRPRGAESDVKL